MAAKEGTAHRRGARVTALVERQDATEPVAALSGR
jgi:hypothetical protein